jgi:transmembrane sensor
MSGHPDSDDFPWDTLARYFAGELPASEAQDLRRWIAAETERAELVEHLHQIWAETGQLRQSWDAESALRRIKQAPAGPARVIRLPRFYHGDLVSPWRRASRVVARAAAVVALVAGSAWMVTHTLARAPDAATPLSEVSTPRGQRALLRLLDGTQVTLGPASTLRYAVTADRGPRTVYLDGDAYFVVTHNAMRPFAVHTAHGTVTDLGTRFGAHAYTSDSVLEVVVAEGKVSLSSHRDTRPLDPSPDSLVLAPGDLGRVSASGRLTMEQGAAVASHLAWTEGRLEFRDTPLREVVAQLGRWYDLEVRLADPEVGRRRLTASFKDEAAPQVLRLVAASLDLRVDRLGGIITLRSN